MNSKELQETCDICEGVIEWDYERLLLTDPPKLKGVCMSCEEVYYRIIKVELESNEQ